MIWVGIAIGIIFTSAFGMVLLVIVSKQKKETIPTTLAEYWGKSLMHQEAQITAIMQIANALEIHNTALLSRRCQFCRHWQVIDRFIGNCDVKNNATHRSGECPEWKTDDI